MPVTCGCLSAAALKNGCGSAAPYFLFAAHRRHSRRVGNMARHGKRRFFGSMALARLALMLAWHGM